MIMRILGILILPLVLIPHGGAGASDPVSVIPAVSLTVAQHQFAKDSIRDKYGLLTLYGFRAAANLNDEIAPFVGLAFGRVDADYPNRLDVAIADLGLRINLAPYRPIGFHVGGAFHALHQKRRVYYSPCLPGNEAVREYTTDGWGYRIMGGPRLALHRKRLVLDLEASHSWARTDVNHNTAHPGGYDLGGWSMVVGVTWLFGETRRGVQLP